MHPEGADQRCEKPREFAASRRQIPAIITNSFVSDIHLWDSGFHCWGIQGAGGIFAGVRLPRLTHQPTATAGRWQRRRCTVIRFGALCSPALRIHTLAPVSFPSAVENPKRRICRPWLGVSPR